MSIFDQLREEKGNRRAINSMLPLHVDLYAEPTGNEKPYTLDANTEHVIKLTIGQTFWANQAQYSMARDAAIRALASHLYRNVHHELHMIELAVYSGSAEDVIAAVSRIRKDITP